MTGTLKTAYHIVFTWTFKTWSRCGPVLPAWSREIQLPTDCQMYHHMNRSSGTCMAVETSQCLLLRASVYTINAKFLYWNVYCRCDRPRPFAIKNTKKGRVTVKLTELAHNKWNKRGLPTPRTAFASTKTQKTFFWLNTWPKVDDTDLKRCIFFLFRLCGSAELFINTRYIKTFKHANFGVSALLSGATGVSFNKPFRLIHGNVTIWQWRACGYQYCAVRKSDIIFVIIC